MAFTNKVVLVTGAASGIGAASVELFMKEGAKVAGVDRDAVGLRALGEKTTNESCAPLFQLVADVANEDDARRIVADTVAEYGKLDILVNSAGIVRRGTILNGNILEAYDEVMKVNLRAVIHLTCLAAPHLISSKGNIINLASIYGLKMPPSSRIYALAYAMSKAGIVHFTRGAALELASYGVRVNSVSPGYTETIMLRNAAIENNLHEFMGYNALQRVLEPREIADCILYLSSDKAKGVTGSNFVVDNGFMLK